MPDVTSVASRVFQELVLDPAPGFRETAECKVAYRKFLMQTSRGLSQGWNRFYINDYSLFGPGGILTEDDDMARWMNRPDVREALHVEDAPVDRWPSPKAGFHYTKEYSACNDEEISDDRSMIDFYRDIAPRLDVTLVYNGDTDPCVTYEGTRAAIAKVGFSEVEGGSYRPWFYNHTAAPLSLLAEKAFLYGPDLLTVPTGAQLGGSVVDYEHGLSFLTVHGSGHMVPQFRPQAALHMLRKVLRRERFSPPIPSDEDLANMKRKRFGSVMNEWTDSAKSPPYLEVEHSGNILDPVASTMLA